MRTPRATILLALGLVPALATASPRKVRVYQWRAVPGGVERELLAEPRMRTSEGSGWVRLVSQEHAEAIDLRFEGLDGGAPRLRLVDLMREDESAPSMGFQPGTSTLRVARQERGYALEVSTPEADDPRCVPMPGSYELEVDAFELPEAPAARTRLAAVLPGGDSGIE